MKLRQSATTLAWLTTAIMVMIQPYPARAQRGSIGAQPTIGSGVSSASIMPGSYRGVITLDQYSWPVVWHITAVANGLPSGNMEGWPSGQPDDPTQYYNIPIAMVMGNDGKPRLDFRSNGNYYSAVEGLPDGRIRARFYSNRRGRFVDVVFSPISSGAHR